MANEAVIKVTGLKELQRALRQFDDGTKDLRKANKAAAQLLADRIAAAVPVKSGKLQRSVKALAQQRAAQVKMGTEKSVPYAGPVEFGDPKRGRPFVKEGRYMFPAAKAAEPEIYAIYDREIDNLIQRNFGS